MLDVQLPLPAAAAHPPLRDSENWVALAVYLVTAVSVSALATRARRRTNEAERALAERDETTAVLRSVSHDLRSPLTAIGASAEMLAEPEGLAESDRAELLASIRRQARRLDRLVGNLLDLSRLEAGAARPCPSSGRSTSSSAARSRRSDLTATGCT